MNSYCYECKKKAPKGKINLDCLACMHAYGVHTQDDNEEASAIFLGFPKADLFEPLKGTDDETAMP